MIAFEDFIKSNYCSFEAKVNIWKREADLFIDIPNTNEKNLKNLLNIIQEEINWIEKNKNKIGDILIEEDILELAENTASSAHLLRCADEECYLMDDGAKVYFPITQDDFLDSLYIESISIAFDNNNDNVNSIELILLCSPDYFRGQPIVILMDNNNTNAKNIKFKGLEES